MTLSQFTCPHCRSPFQVDTPLPSLQVACPHCRQPVTLISEPPVSEPPVAEPPLAPSPGIDRPPVDFGIAELPAPVRRGYSTADLLPPRSTVSSEEVMPKQAEKHQSISNDYRSRQLVVDERVSRKLVKNMIVWVCCAIVLVVILAFFLTQGGS